MTLAYGFSKYCSYVFKHVAIKLLILGERAETFFALRLQKCCFLASLYTLLILDMVLWIEAQHESLVFPIHDTSWVYQDGTGPVNLSYVYWLFAC